MKKQSILDRGVFSSKISSINIKPIEAMLGYLIGPFFALIINAVFTSFLNTFYTDVLGMVGLGFGNFLTFLPLFSTILVAAGNILVGLLIDKTNTSQGKARPFILIAAPLLMLSCILIFAVPAFGVVGKIIWVTITYNLYFAVAYPIYFLSHSMMVPLSTRNLKQRGNLSVISNLANIGAAGLFASVVFPMFLSFLGVNQNMWLLVMGILGTFACVGALFEYYFTRERITEEATPNIIEQRIPISKQLKGVITDKFWWIIIIFYLLFQFGGAFKNLSMVYYCNYIVGTYADGFTMPLLAALSGLPLGIGAVIVWPLASRLGKKNLTVLGLVISVVGGIIAISNPYNFVMVVVGVTIKSLGSVPACYVMMALFADVLDHLEYKNGFRCDGLSMSLFSIITVAALGVCTGIFNGLLSTTGYLEPINNVAQVQTIATQNVFIAGYIGIELVAYGILAVLLLFLGVEKNIKLKQETIILRQKEKVLANGEEWIEPEERARREQEIVDAKAEEDRIKELMAYCKRKGKDFSIEEQKYQNKLMSKRKK